MLCLLIYNPTSHTVELRTLMWTATFEPRPDGCWELVSLRYAFSLV